MIQEEVDAELPLDSLSPPDKPKPHPPTVPSSTPTLTSWKGPSSPYNNDLIYPPTTGICNVTTTDSSLSLSSDDVPEDTLSNSQQSWTTEEEDEGGEGGLSFKKHGQFVPESEEDSSDEPHRKADSRWRVPNEVKPISPKANESKNAAKPKSFFSFSRGGTAFQFFQLKPYIDKAVNCLQAHQRHPGRRHPFVREVDIFFLRIFILMAKYHRELCIVFLLFASGLATLRSGPIKTRQTPAPKPFFSLRDGSFRYLQDNFRGDYISLVQMEIPKGPALIFYYAPWDSESKAARDVFLSVAKYFHRTLPNQVRFFAVNCWFPDGECRKNYKNLSHFPIFVGHLENNSGIIYNGPIRTELIVHFINSLLKPLTRLDTEEEMWRFRAQHDAIMLGYFNFSNAESAQSYETYLQMALRSFESDPFGQTGFGVFLKQSLAEKFFLTSSNTISLVLFNEIHTAKWSGDRHTQGVRGPVGQVANWVVERTKKTPVTWVYQIRTGFANRPVSLGPVDLARELVKGPVILLVARRYFPSSYSPFYAQVKEVALDYFNCNKSGNVTKLRRITHQLNADWITLWNSVSKICESSSEPGGGVGCATMSPQLYHWRLKKGQLVRETLSNYENISARLNFTGFSCESERKFKFFAVDPVDMPEFVELGLNGFGLDNKSGDPLLLVIDAQNDMILPITSFNISILANFIYEYTNEMEAGDEQSSFTSAIRVEKRERPSGSRLQQRSEEPFEFSFEIRELTKTDSTATGIQPSSMLEPQKNNARESRSKAEYIKTFTSDDLLRFLKKEEPFRGPNSLFLMFTAKYCGSCGVSLGSFLGLARFLQENYQNNVLGVTFAKLDMYKNSLPPGLSPKNIPTFVYFPSQNRTRSLVFPVDEVINPKTLLRFLLAQLDPETRVKLSLLSPTCRKSEELRSSGTVKDDLLNGTTSNFSVRNGCLVGSKDKISSKISEILIRIQEGVAYHQTMSEEEALSGLDPDGMMEMEVKNLEMLRAMELAVEVS